MLRQVDDQPRGEDAALEASETAPGLEGEVGVNAGVKWPSCALYPGGDGFPQGKSGERIEIDAWAYP